jgi:hypothetical protein
MRDMTDNTPFAGPSHIAMLQRPYGPRIHRDEHATGGSPSGDTSGASAPETFSSPTEAARHYAERIAERRYRRDNQGAADAGAADNNSSAASADPATADTQLPDEGNAAHGDNHAPGENEGNDAEASRLPPVARPRSWAKDEQAEWDDLPRSLQEKIAAREDTREKALRKGQNDAATQLKGLTAKEQAADQARTSYESHVKAALAVLEREQQADFSDIRTTADVTLLAQTDPLRWLQWKAHQDELAWATEAARQADERAATQKSDEWKSFRSAEDAKAVEHIPDLGNAEKAPALMRKAVSHLQDLGFTADELNGYDKGEKLSLFDHRIQRLIFDAMRYQGAQKAANAAANRPVPSVMRPGARQPTGGASSERVAALDSKLNNSGSLRDAVALRIAKRNAARR